MATATMEQVLRGVLSSGNKEQNQMYPPHIFNTHFNLVTSFLVDQVAELFPTSQSIVDIIRPFLATRSVPVRSGLIQFPDDYRHLLGVGIFVTPDYKDNCASLPDFMSGVVRTGDCCNDEQPDDECASDQATVDARCLYPNDPLAPTMTQIKEKQERGKCISQSVSIVDIDEWDHLTSHSYKYPTLRKPLGCIFRGEGIKICPYDVPVVEIRYIKQPTQYLYGYVMNPDDTYSFDAATTIESEWTNNAMQYLVKGITTLYSIYTRDGELRDGMLELKRAGIF